VGPLGRGLTGRDNGGDLINVQYKANQNCHSETPLYNEYILINIYNNKKDNLDRLLPKLTKRKKISKTRRKNRTLQKNILKTYITINYKI
jgi:hypothetical protein